MAETRDVIILGAGCAGWTAAIYAARANLQPLLITGQTPGGQLGLTTGVENYPGFPDGILGPELMDRMEQQARRYGTEVVIDWVTEVDFSGRPLRLRTAKDEYTAPSVIVCTGSEPRKLGIPGETELWGHGVSACATCDGFFFRDKVITVVGGGDTAAEEATYLTKFAARVYLVHRRDALRASKAMQERVFGNDKIELVWDTVVTEVVGTDGVVSGARLRNLKTDEERLHPTDGFFIAIGHDPQTKLFAGQLETDENGYLVTDQYQRTNLPGVFAAGDVQDHVWQQAVTAAGTGCAAALAAEKYLEGLRGEVYPDERRTEIVEGPAAD